ncbi:MAG: LLM class F420-dependent oxidoreductase [Mycobacteriales bacterium]
MRLGLNLGYAGAADAEGSVVLALEAERLGYDIVWAAEAYGSDAATVLAWIGSATTRIKLGSAVFQIPARTAAMTAMTAATLDNLSGGRFSLGLGLSGPQVSEGWHGVRYDAPLQRTREYVDVVRMMLGGERVRYQGAHITLPLPDGPGKALSLALRPGHHLHSLPGGRGIPIYLAAMGPKNLALAGELEANLLPLFFAAEHADYWLAPYLDARERVTAERGGCDIAPTFPLVIADDIAAAADVVRPNAALYVGGMGSREKNFYAELAGRYGYETQARVVQDLFLSGDKAGAEAAVPFEFIDKTSLIGAVDRVADRLQALRDVGVTTVSVTLFGATVHERIEQLRSCAAAFDKAGVGQ